MDCVGDQVEMYKLLPADARCTYSNRDESIPPGDASNHSRCVVTKQESANPPVLLNMLFFTGVRQQLAVQRVSFPKAYSDWSTSGSGTNPRVRLPRIRGCVPTLYKGQQSVTVPPQTWTKIGEHCFATRNRSDDDGPTRLRTPASRPTIFPPSSAYTRHRFCNAA